MERAATLNRPSVPFDVWRAQLQQDAVDKSKNKILDIIPEVVMRLAWEEGSPPKCESLGPRKPTRANFTAIYFST